MDLGWQFVCFSVVPVTRQISFLCFSVRYYGYCVLGCERCQNTVDLHATLCLNASCVDMVYDAWILYSRCPVGCIRSILNSGDLCWMAAVEGVQLTLVLIILGAYSSSVVAKTPGNSTDVWITEILHFCTWVLDKGINFDNGWFK